MSKLASRTALGGLILLAILFIATIVAANTSFTQRTIKTEIVINASASRVWQVLTNFEAYPQWNPFIRHIGGPAWPGGRLTIELNSGGISSTIIPTVLAVKPARELAWLGRLFMPGVFDGEHRFTIEPQGEGRVRFVQSETFRGILVPFSGPILSSTEGSFRKMNHALKERAESRGYQ